MPALVDTCGWIEWLIDGELADQFEESLAAEGPDLIVPTVVQYELYKWVEREFDRRRALETAAITRRGLIVPVNSELALLAGDLSLDYQLPMAHAMIYAAARATGACLVTSDGHFEGLDEVRFVSKSPLN